MNTTPSHVYFDALLKPNQSLSRAGFAVIMGVVVVVNLLSALAFLSRGAFPILGFLGLDILAVWLAFKLCFRNQAQWTRVQITPDVLRVDHVNPKGHASFVELPTAFARIELTEPVTAHSWLTLAHGQEAYVIGRFLTLQERKTLAEALRAGLSDARAHRYAGET